MRLKPFGDKLLVKKISDEKIGKIIMPDSKKYTSTRGVIVDTGDTVNKAVFPIGSDIFFGQHAAFEMPTSDYNDLRGLPELYCVNAADVITINTKKEFDYGE